ncbi:PspC domain-containing protein [bacterium]|nr:PspC domain-containing protein [bacterium]
MSDTAAYKRLFRSRRDRVIGGVCGGAGGYLNIDPVVLRIIWLAAVLLGGVGLIAYLIAWILIPEAPEGRDPGKVERETDGVRILAVILIVISLIWLASRIFGHSFHWVHIGWIGPAALIALGVALLMRPSVHAASEIAPEPMAQTEEAGDEGETDDTDEESGKKRTFETSGIRRSRRDRVLLGVCGGLAKHWRVDATLIRVICALGTVLGAGVLLIAYLVLALVIPDEEEL